MRRIDGLAVAAEVLENPLDDGRRLDARDHAQAPAAAPARLEGTSAASRAIKSSGANITWAHAMGVTRVSIPNRTTKSADRKKHQKTRWFRNAQEWRAGSERRISVVKPFALLIHMPI